jgi:type IV fimbrial biogenesis protein FimT
MRLDRPPSDVSGSPHRGVARFFSATQMARRLLSWSATMRAATSTRAFSLLELLCALGVTSLLLAIALPRASAIIPALTLDRTANQLAAEIGLARLKAINRNTRARVVCDLAEARYGVEVESEGTFAPEGSSRALPGGVTFDAAQSSRVIAGHVTVTFLPRGHTADNATIVLTASGGSTRRVIVSTGGRVRTQ